MNDITSTMNEEQKTYYKQSVIDFENILRPFLEDKIYNCFDIKITTDVELDREHGIDCRVYTINNNNIEGFYVAYKMQKVSTPYETICIRYSRGSGRKTEFEKMLELISVDGIRPQIHAHAYCNYAGEMLVCYLVRTDELIEWVSRHLDIIDRRYKGQDSFLSINVSDLKSAGIAVAELRKENGRLYIT